MKIRLHEVINLFSPSLAKTVPFVSLLCLTLYDFTHQGREPLGGKGLTLSNTPDNSPRQGRASGWERVASVLQMKVNILNISLQVTFESGSSP